MGLALGADMTDPSPAAPRAADALLRARVDAIVLDWQSRHDRAGDGDSEYARPLHEVVTGIVHMITAAPSTEADAHGWLKLAHAAARHGAARQGEGAPVERVPFEYSVLFETLWGALAVERSTDQGDAHRDARIQQALNLALAAALVGYEFTEDATKRPALPWAVEQCCRDVLSGAHHGAGE